MSTEEGRRAGPQGAEPAQRAATGPVHGAPVTAPAAAAPSSADRAAEFAREQRERDVESFDAVVRAARRGAEGRLAGHPTPPRPARAPGTPATVLVIDDDEALRAAVRRNLETSGYCVLEATGGRHALTQLRSGAGVDFLVTDLKMEDGSGGWLLAQLAYENPELLPRTVVMAGDPEGTAAAHVAARWHCPVLGKPVSREQLVGTLASLEQE